MFSSQSKKILALTIPARKLWTGSDFIKELNANSLLLNIVFISDHQPFYIRMYE